MAFKFLNVLVLNIAEKLLAGRKTPINQSIIYQDFLILHIFLHDSDSLIRIHAQCTEFYLIIGYLKICNFSDPRKIVLATQHLLLIFDIVNVDFPF